jgi:hypothetical protein
MGLNLISFVKSLFNKQDVKTIDKKNLPSQGLFYKDDFDIKVKKANIESIIDYEYGYSKDDIGIIIYKVKKIVEDNIILPKIYVFSDIKSIDVIFLFLEIVKFTKNEPIKFTYINEEGKEDIVEFGEEYFNYFKIDDATMRCYNNVDKVFEINGYKYSLPSIGIENCLTNFLLSKSDEPGAEKYNEYFYDFTYFLSNRNNITFDELDNLIQIFNSDIDDKEYEKIKDIMCLFVPIQKYSLIKNNKVIDINAKINLEKIWK